ncbi:MAG: PEGA domain-containing protein [Myxococcaceae bacterium]
MLSLALALCLHAAPDAPARSSVTVVVDGPRAAETRRALGTLTLPVELRLVDLPPAAPLPPPSPWPEKLAAARKLYVAARFTECLAELEGENVVPTLLADAERNLAARVLAWRAACHLGANQSPAAQADTKALAAFSLSPPPDVASMTPEVESLLARAASQATPAAEPLRIDSTPSGATVDLDGRPGACRTPCTVNVLEGPHVVRLSADGYTPAWRLVSGVVPAVSLEPASPELAAEQWRERNRRGEPLDSEASLKLLSTALRSPRLALVASEAATPEALRGALALDGVLTTRAAREADAGGLVKDLLVRGKVVEEAPPLYARWPFWLAVGGAAVAAGVTAAVVVGTKQTVTRVELNP